MSGCKSCGSGKRKMDICEVHRLVDGDSTVRLVKWCELCKAYICDDCKPRKLKRAQAAALRLLEPSTPNP